MPQPPVPYTLPAGSTPQPTNHGAGILVALGITDESPMPTRITHLTAQIALFALLTWMPAGAQTQPRIPEYSGMYSFLRDGEFVQITVEDQGRLTGFISRYGDSDSDRGAFLDHFFKSGKIDGNLISFATDVVHGVSFEFKGTIERGEGKTPGAEAYYVLKGALMETTIDDAKKASSRSLQVELKSFPQDMAPPAAEKK